MKLVLQLGGPGREDPLGNAGRGDRDRVVLDPHGVAVDPDGGDDLECLVARSVEQHETGVGVDGARDLADELGEDVGELRAVADRARDLVEALQLPLPSRQLCLARGEFEEPAGRGAHLAPDAASRDEEEHRRDREGADAHTEAEPVEILGGAGEGDDVAGEGRSTHEGEHRRRHERGGGEHDRPQEGGHGGVAVAEPVGHQDGEDGEAGPHEDESVGEPSGEDPAPGQKRQPDEGGAETDERIEDGGVVELVAAGGGHGEDAEPGP